MSDDLKTLDNDCTVTEFGFAWGNVEVTRTTTLPDGCRVVTIAVNGEHRLDVYVSRTGRSIRAFDKRKFRELQ